MAQALDCSLLPDWVSGMTLTQDSGQVSKTDSIAGGVQTCKYSAVYQYSNTDYTVTITITPK